jgi:hypothetical protein
VSDSTIPDHLPPDVGLADRHRALLEASAVDLAVAAESGCVTVSSASDLPADLSGFAFAVPGLIFVHNPLGGGASVPQLRPDEPIEGGGKYLLPPGATPVVSCHPRMAARVADASRALIVEGTKQYLAAVSAAPDDILVVGITGCRGWSHNSVPLPDLNLVARRSDGERRSVAICFDADVETNRDVYDAAKGLGGHLAVIGASEVRYVRIEGAGAEAGLDDYLAVVPEKTRSDALAQLIERAPTKLGRRPAEKKHIPTPAAGGLSDKEAKIDEDAAVVRLSDRMVEDRVIPGKILLRAAPVIVETFSQVDDLDPDLDAIPATGHRIEVTIGTGDDRRAYPVAGPVWDSELTSVSSWLARTPGGVGSTVAPLAEPMVTSMIAGAMRGHRIKERRWVKVLSRTGWVESDDGTWAYAHSNGAISAAGLHKRVHSSLGQFIGWGPEDLAIDPTETTRAVLGVADLLVDPSPWWAALSLLVHALAGGVPSGALNLRGSQGSGKSTIASLVASALGRRYIGEPMCVFTGSDAGRRTLGAGLHHCLIVIDDMPPAGNRREASEQAAALSSLARGCATES